MSTSMHVRSAAAFAAFVLIALCATTAGVVVSAPRAAAASADGPCAGTSGVTVVVDATNAGGDISVRCALGPQASGWDALQGAGHDIASVPQYPGSAVCKIDGRPAAGYPSCWQTNFWSYFHAPSTAAGAWKFSGSGAATYQPPPGSVEGWKYTSVTTQNDPPGRGPAFATSTPTTQAPPPPPAASNPPPTIRGAAPAPANAAPPRPPTTPSGATTTTLVPGAVGQSAPTERSTTTTMASDDRRGDASRRALDPVDVSSQGSSSGNGAPIGTIVGVALVIGIAGAAGAVAYRRRTSHATDA